MSYTKVNAKTVAKGTVMKSFTGGGGGGGGYGPAFGREPEQVQRFQPTI
ncbi:hypothetical protein [Exilibacterium tricleocarpae]|nr:hypothetical protein [Exilibacterium tricleocarpae]